jgi:hypothetical protein
LTSSGYLHRLNERRQLNDLKQAVLFGLIIGWIMTLVGAFHFFFMLEGQVWLYTCCFGIALLAATLVLPEVVSLGQRFMHKIAAFVTGYLLKGVCATIYFIAVLPLGLLFQKTKGTHPFYTWTDRRPRPQKDGSRSALLQAPVRAVQQGSGRFSRSRRNCCNISPLTHKQFYCRV